MKKKKNTRGSSYSGLDDCCQEVVVLSNRSIFLGKGKKIILLYEKI